MVHSANVESQIGSLEKTFTDVHIAIERGANKVER
jgi:hypothetical protein